MESSPLPAFYNAAPIIVWVEDLVTSVYLQALWQPDPRLHYEQLRAGREPQELMELRDVLLERLARPLPPP